MRARREAVARWESAIHRPYLYAGKGMGADIAAWKQVARAELAGIASHTVGYGIALLDLVKASERVPHRLLALEAEALGFPIFLLRLSLVAYRLPRSLRIGNAFSYLLVAGRGIVAGSGIATAEMKLTMVRLIDRVCKLTPMVVLTFFVDDVGAEIMGPAKVVANQLTMFARRVAKSVVDTAMQLSSTNLSATPPHINLGLPCRKA